jgi:hypothetical protein
MTVMPQKKQYFLNILLTVRLDICVEWNEPDALFIFSLFSHYISTCFGFASSPPSGGNNVHMRQLVVDCRGRRLKSYKTYNTDQLSLIYNVTPDYGLLAIPKHIEV